MILQLKNKFKIAVTNTHFQRPNFYKGVLFIYIYKIISGNL